MSLVIRVIIWKKIKKTAKTPIIGNWLILMIRIGQSSKLKWVNDLRKTGDVQSIMGLVARKPVFGGLRKNKGADQPAHLISASVIHLL